MRDRCFVMGKRRRIEDQLEDSGSLDTPRRKLPRLKHEFSPSVDRAQYQELSQPETREKGAASPRSPRVTSVTARFLDESFYNSNSQRSVKSYKQFLDHLASSFGNTSSVYDVNDSASYREWCTSWKQWQCPLNIPDDERIIELSDDDDHDDNSSEVRASGTDMLSDIKDPRSPTLAKILNTDEENKHSRKGNDSDKLLAETVTSQSGQGEALVAA